ncbi:MAG: NAD(P)H-hydrate dehydratase [Candidatus Aenigmarchaeota archaeon]|nr:NAD(P)H-hydrate dehydratase [Candidatus Aenigmarchaeota archaeon]
MVEIKKILKEIYRKRENDVHKYDFGSVLVIGGSEIYSGSPAFNALAAIRSGTDLAEIAAPERSANIVAGFSPDLITHQLKGKFLKKEHLKQIHEISKNKTAVVIGGGLGREKDTLKAIRQFLSETKLPCVIDADAIHAITEGENLLREKKFIITPHAYEFFILTGEEVSGMLKEREKQVKKFAENLGTTILLKGYVDIISDGTQVYLNKTGSPYMTKGGTGDVLAGVTGALLAKGVGCFEAACCAAHLNGKAGELAGRNFGDSMLASDLLDELSREVSKKRLLGD